MTEIFIEKKQEAQSYCDVFPQWGAKTTDQTRTKSLPKETRYWQESLDGDLVGRIQAGSFR